jgi:Zn finger protein HypA/HybF involved in hydrogenase expression
MFSDHYLIKINKMRYDWNCLFCDTEFEVTEDIDGECPNCHEKYIWDWDGEYDYDSVWTICWENEGRL